MYAIEAAGAMAVFGMTGKKASLKGTISTKRRKRFEFVIFRTSGVLH